MIVSLAGTLAAAALFGAAAPRVAATARPWMALWVLTVGGLLMSAFTGLAVGMVVVGGLGRVPAVARLQHWSPSAMGHANAFPPLAGVLALIAVGICTVRLLRVALREGRQLLRAWSCARVAPAGLMVVDGSRVAYALPGWPGRIVVSRALLQELDPPGRRALLAHEQAHLSGHHDLHQLLAMLWAAWNPLLRTLPAAVRTACERLADERSARAVGDRRVVVAAILRAVQLPPGRRLDLAAGGGDVAARIACLVRPRRRDRRPLLLPLALLALAAITVAWLGRDLDALTDAAALVTGSR